MKLTTNRGMVIEVDPQNQRSIDAAREKAGAGNGIGPAVSGALVQMIQEGKITRRDELPEEYRPTIGRMLTERNSAVG